MFRKRKLIRIIAIFFAVEMLASIAQPYVAMALTAGPTSPEATSFEPVDTTDMVNPLTGDFVYNIPLLEVPGPAGGYPVSMSYHAGIMSQEEASWVGLGWTLNPGAINRHVNGFADDHHNAEQNSRFFWEGGETRQAKIGITYGAGGVGYSQGIEIGTDTYQGFGVGAYASVGVYLNDNIGIGVQGGVDPWGNESASVGVIAQVGGVNAGVGISTNGWYGYANTTGGMAGSGVGISTNFESISANLSLPGVSTGTTISSKGVSTSLNAGIGKTTVNQGNSGQISTRSFSLTLPIPFVNLGYKYRRYWIDRMESVATHGILHNPQEQVENLYHFDENAYDSYSLASINTLAHREDPAKTLEGTFAAYDSYKVNAQGVTGNIAPHAFRKHMYRQNKIYYNDDDKRYDFIHQPTERDFENNPIHFRFINDFSNRHVYKTEELNFNTTDATRSPFTYDFDNPPATGEPDGLKGYHDNNLAGSKYVKFFTNSEIGNNPAEFIETVSTGFNRNAKPDEQIGGYQVTNETGVTYHFSLPAYAMEEFYYSEKLDHENRKAFNYQSKPEPYAYTWHLTALTGPDYVDRGEPGFDEDDWGYWVELEYGKWTDQYVWRTPGEGLNIDLDTDWKNYGEGVKELYYLDAIRTKTHTALFVKDIRDDAKSANLVKRDRYYSNPDLTGSFKEIVRDVNTKGGFIPQNITYTESAIFNSGKVEQYYSKPVSSLKLSKIILKENSNTSFDKSTGSEFSQSYSITSSSSTRVIQQHNPNNVLDISDIGSAFSDNALRVIAFDNDNETLCMETINSFSHPSLDGDNIPSTNPDDYELKGKLALKSISFKGKGGQTVIPPLTFDYELENQVQGQGLIEEISDTHTDIGHYYLSTSSNDLQIGDIIEFSNNSKRCYASIYASKHTGKYYIQVLGANPIDLGNIWWETTKNPPFGKESYDEWGMFKGDYRYIGNDHIDRLRTLTSKKQVDVWSLRSIDTSLGSTIKIEYESDSYKKAVLTNNYPLVIKRLDPDPDAYRTSITVEGDIATMDYFYKAGDHVSLLYIYTEGVQRCNEGTNNSYPVYSKASDGLSGVIESVSGNVITVKSKCLSQYFGKRKYFEGEYEPECQESYNPSYNQGVPPDDGGGDDGGECKQYVIRHFQSGNLRIFNPNFTVPGGGIRVTSLSIVNPLLNTSTNTLYDYLQSGVTSYAPKVLDKYLLNSEYDDNDLVAGIFRTLLYRSFSSLIAMTSEVPAPGVMYSRVNVESSTGKANESGVTEHPFYYQYSFEVFGRDMLNEELQNYSIPQNLMSSVDNGLRFSYDHGKSIIREVTLKDFSTRVGNLKSITKFSKNDTKVSETRHHYLHDGIDNDEFKEQLFSKYNDQGKITETFVDSRAIKLPESNYFKLYGTVSTKEKYPSIVIGKTTINYLTGTTTTSKNLSFDFFSGEVSKILTQDSYGNITITESIPAYKNYSGMGLAINGGANMLTQFSSSITIKAVRKSVHSMSLQYLNSGSSYSWYLELDDMIDVGTNTVLSIEKDDEEYLIKTIRNVGDGYEVEFLGASLDPTPFVVNVQGTIYNTGIMASNVQTWSDRTPELDGQSGVFRKHRAYSFLGNDIDVSQQPGGIYPSSSFQEFDAWGHDQEPSSDQWQKNSEITLYDVYSHALEAEDVNGNFAATKMDNKQEYVYSTVANAHYNEFAYSGAEDELEGQYFGGDVLNLGGTITTAKAHTGFKSIKTTATTQAPFNFIASDLQDGRTYRASIWSTKSTVNFQYQVAGEGVETITSTSQKKAGQWYLHNADVVYNGTQDLQVTFSSQESSTVYWDDFRFHPIDATMTSYVYNNWGELSHILDANNIYTKYEYDGMGRLKSTYRESFNHGETKTSDYEINYAKAPGVTIQASSEGDAGFIDPLGQINLRKGGEIAFSTSDLAGCSHPMVDRVLIDGAEVASSTTLADGTLVDVSGSNYTFSNVQSDHQIHMEFRPMEVVIEDIWCHVDGFNQDTPNCKTGKYGYSYRDECGDLIIIPAVDGEDIPGNDGEVSILPDCTRNCDGPVEEI